jgi:hypothetical protein
VSATAASAHARLRDEQKRSRFTPDRVWLSDHDTVTADELTPGDVFVHDAHMYVCVSALLESGVVQAHHFRNRTEHVQLHFAEDDQVLVFV